MNPNPENDGNRRMIWQLDLIGGLAIAAAIILLQSPDASTGTGSSRGADDQ